MRCMGAVMFAPSSGTAASLLHTRKLTLQIGVSSSEGAYVVATVHLCPYHAHSTTPQSALLRLLATSNTSCTSSACLAAAIFSRHLPSWLCSDCVMVVRNLLPTQARTLHTQLPFPLPFSQESKLETGKPGFCYKTHARG